jgi:hypothetical protein
MKAYQEIAASTRTQIIESTHKVLQLWSTNDPEMGETSTMGRSADNRPDYRPLAYIRGYEWPTVPSEEAFYSLCSLLSPVNGPPFDCWSRQSMRKLMHSLRSWCDTQARREREDPEVRRRMDELIGVFDASCDIVDRDHEVNSIYDNDEQEEWERNARVKQAQAMEDFKKYYEPSFTGQTPLEIWGLVDGLSLLWCEHSKAVEDGNEAEMNLMEQLA